MTRIFKFGGASVKDAPAIRNLESILLNEKYEHLVIVISAMDKTTSRLEKIAGLAYERKEYLNELKDIEDFHTEIINELGIENEIGSFLRQLRGNLQNTDQNWYKFLDGILPFGELLSTKIISMYLSQKFPVIWSDARELVFTDSSFGEARIEWQKTSDAVKEKINSDQINVTQGYIGSDAHGNMTTLGKEGSDFTAAILAHILDASDVTVWKDVPGILNADPKLMDETELFPTLSYQEITEMTYYGAKVIHPKTIAPIAKKGIPLLVRSFKYYKSAGTRIDAEDQRIVLPTYIFKFNELVITLRVKDSSFMDEVKMMKIFEVLHQNNVKVNLMQNSALTFTFCFEFHQAKFQAIQEAFQYDFSLTYNDDLHLATIKNYTDDSIGKLPEPSQIIIEQKSRSVYQRLYRV